MAHLIDNSKGFNAFVSFQAPAWHKLGTVVTEAISTQQALELAGLDFQVLKLPNIQILPSGKELISDTSFFTLRTDVEKVLFDRIGKNYEVFQNHEALNIVDEILQTGIATIETAGSIDEGRKVFITLKINKSLIIGGKDVVNQYLVVATSHDTSLPITALLTNIRVVCNNTLTAALGKGAINRISIKHTASATNRLTEALKVLNLIESNQAKNEDTYNTLLETVISKETMFDYFGNIFLSKEEIKSLQAGKKITEVVSTRKQNTLAEVLNYANKGTGIELTRKGSDVTAWTAYNAVTEYVTRKRYADANDRANSLLFGSASETLELAGNLALAPNKIEVLHKTNFNNLNLN